MVMKPVESAMGTRTASKPPMAHANWKPLSKRANERPLTPGGHVSLHHRVEGQLP